MEITGRLTGDAEVKKVKGNKEVVSFTVAVNEGYKNKAGEWVDMTEFVSCSYWLSSAVADKLIKGCIVTVAGRIYLNEYTGKDGNKYANLAFHANGIKILGGAKKGATVGTSPGVPADTPETKDDLPF
jgi:single-strand DNA-binding protein